jgi:beta-lactamase regulating signal transducer with metallopeptidase domain
LRRFRRKAVESSNIVWVLFGAFGVFFVVLAILLLYRGTLSTREDNQICIDKEKQHHVEEQKEIIAKITRLRTPIILLTVISAVLLLSAVRVWLYLGLRNF